MWRYACIDPMVETNQECSLESPTGRDDCVLDKTFEDGAFIIIH